MSTMHQAEQDGEKDRALQELRTHLAGQVIEPQDPLYDEARAVWNGMIDVRPRAVIRAAGVGDIDPVLHTARRTGLPLAVRGGGHNIAGHGTVDGGLVLDLGQLRGVEVEVERRLVTVEPGVYFPGWGGIRIEDDVLVTRTGYELLTAVPKDLDECLVG